MRSRTLVSGKHQGIWHCHADNHTPERGRGRLCSDCRTAALRPAGGVLRTADDFRRFSICSNHHRGSYPSPALAYASYPFVDLPPGIILRCKLFPSDKFAEIRLYFFYEIAYNGAGDKSEFGGENMTAHMRLR